MKKFSILVLLLLISTLGLAGCGEKASPTESPSTASPIELPAIESISSIEIAGGIEDIIITDKERIAAFVKKVGEAKLTSKQSNQDVPTVSEYTRVDIVSGGNISSIFIYQEDSKWYIEQPYRGIYETDDSILKLLNNN